MMNRNEKPLMVEDMETGEEFKVPTHFEVCPRCDGRGVHDHPAFSNGLTQEDFDEDPDFREDYFRGRYDVPCSECGGLRVVPVPDWEQMSPKLRELVETHFRVEREMEAERAAEARWGF